MCLQLLMAEALLGACLWSHSSQSFECTLHISIDLSSTKGAQEPEQTQNVSPVLESGYGPGHTGSFISITWKCQKSISGPPRSAESAPAFS